MVGGTVDQASARQRGEETLPDLVGRLFQVLDRSYFDRSDIISCLKYSDHFGLLIDKFNHMSLEGYYEKFGRDIVIEFDHRFSKREDLITPKHKAGQVYGNILDEEMDFIAKFENFDRDMAAIGARIGLPGKATAVVEHSVNRIDRASLALDSRREIAHLFWEDIRRFSYNSE